MLLLGVVAVPGFFLTFSLLGLRARPPAGAVGRPPHHPGDRGDHGPQPAPLRREHARVPACAGLRRRDVGAARRQRLDRRHDRRSAPGGRPARARPPHRRRAPPRSWCTRATPASRAPTRHSRCWSTPEPCCTRRPSACSSPACCARRRTRPRCRRTRWCATRATATARSSKRTATPSPCTRASGSTACSRRRSSPRARARSTAPTRCGPSTAGRRDDIDGVMLTWRFLEQGWRVFHEPLAVGVHHRAASRSARGRPAASRAARSISSRPRARRASAACGSASTASSPCSTPAARCSTSRSPSGLALALLLAAFGTPALLGLYRAVGAAGLGRDDGRGATGVATA